jgi:ABC-type glycerol-3-phosphate transport system substrate-binding protein
VDEFRTWRITRYIPETEAYLNAYDVILRDLLERLSVHATRSGNTSALSTLDQALALLDILREDPDELPLHLNYLASFGGADSSIVKLCAAASDTLLGRGFNVDMIYLHGDTELPAENASLGDSLNAGASQVWSSYTNPKYIVRNREDALNIWVNQSVLMTDAIQKLIDTRFTPQTGIEVNLSVMPDVQKLVLSEAAGTNPDMALGLEAHIPFDLASRGALYDMNQFEDYWNVADGMVPGSFISYVFNEGIYAMPESVNFYAMVYRTDILNSLGLTPPDTWDEVAAMMATLQRFNMSFYMPVATGEGYKWFYQTAPLIYQNGGSLYAPDGLSATIGEPEAVKAITDFGELFTTYALEYQVPSFFNSFRFGQTPIGIVDSGTYLLLRTNAPELAGQWELAPHPGTAQADGSVSRWYIGNGRGAVIFKDAKFDKEVCWDFLKWWVSDEIQTEYAFNLAANSNILWLSANLNALESTPMIEDDHIGVVMDSVMWLRDVPRSPGQYLLERSLSDIWNAMVTQDTPARAAIDERLVEIQREFRRKMREFGYIDDANTPLKPYTVREMDWVLAKLKEAGQ